MKSKKDLIFNGYLLDNQIISILLITLPLGLIWFTILAFANNLYYLIPDGLCIVVGLYIILKLVKVRTAINSDIFLSKELNNHKAYLKIKPETKSMGEMLVKIYIKSNGKRFDYFYLNGSKSKFINYVDVINNSSNVSIEFYKKTNIINNIICDGIKLEDLYKKVDICEPLKSELIYNHFLTNKEIVAKYPCVAYNYNNAFRILANSNILDELYIVNNEGKYIKISNNPENKCVYFNKKIVSEEALYNWLYSNGFIFDNNIKVFYTFDHNNPSYFQFFIDSE